MIKSLSKRELYFQVLLHLIVFLFLSFDKKNPQIHLSHLAYFANYALGALIINYWILPKYYQNHKLWQFVGSVSLVILMVVLAEELVVEQIFSPLERARTIKIFYSFLDVAPVIAILSGFKFGWDALTKQKQLDNLHKAVKESELQFLKSQINPHFLFNNLNNIYSYALEGSKKTPEIILELSGILRYMLYECKEDYVSLTKELLQLENFINLNELQIEDRGKVSFYQSGNFNAYKISPLILIVFVENAFKHSLGSQSEDIHIDISISISDHGLLSFHCSNTYLEISNNDNLTSGIGLENVRKRLNLVYPNAHKLNTIDKDGHYRIELDIDLSKMQDK